LVVIVKGSVDAGNVVASELRYGNRAERGGSGGESSRYVMMEKVVGVSKRKNSILNVLI